MQNCSDQEIDLNLDLWRCWHTLVCYYPCRTIVASPAAFCIFDTKITSVAQKLYIRSLESGIYLLDQLAGELDYVVAYSETI